MSEDRIKELEKELRKAQALLRFRQYSFDDIPPCVTCGRIMLAGKCCDGPHTWEQVAKDLQGRIEHTKYWYSTRMKAIEEYTKQHGFWSDMAALFANGTIKPTESFTWAQIYNEMKHRAEAAEKKVADMSEGLHPDGSGRYDALLVERRKLKEEKESHAKTAKQFVDTQAYAGFLEKQIQTLAEFILSEVPGEPSENEGAIECAIRIIQKLQEKNNG